MPTRKNPDKKVAKSLPLIKDADTERLRQNIYRSDMEKLALFTKMLRRNALYNKASVTHK
jgi:hypothetical protein